MIGRSVCWYKRERGQTNSIHSQLNNMKFFSSIIVLLLATLSIAAPADIASSAGGLTERGSCTCHEIGNTGEYICTGSTCV